MNCSKCGFLMNDLETECRRCQHFAARKHSQPSSIQSPPSSAVPIATERPGSPRMPRQSVSSSSAQNSSPGATPSSPPLTGPFCSHCGGRLPGNARFCLHCGTSVGAALPPAAQVYDSGYNPSNNSHPPAHVGMIVTMWAMQIGGWLLAVAMGVMALGFLCDGIAFVLAIILVCNKPVADKANGWIKIGLEMIAFCLAVSVYSQRPPPI